MNKGLIALGVIVGIRVTIAILNHNKKSIVKWAKKRIKDNEVLNDQQRSVIMAGQSKLVMDYNVLLQEIFKDGGFPSGKSTQEVLDAALKKIQDLRILENISETYDETYKIPVYEELEDIVLMLESIEDGYLDIDDRYNDSQISIVKQCLTRRKLYLEKTEIENQKGETTNDIE